MREQAEAAGEVQRRAQEEAETLRQQLTSSQRDAQAALTKQVIACDSSWPLRFGN